MPIQLIEEPDSIRLVQTPSRVERWGEVFSSCLFALFTGTGLYALWRGKDGMLDFLEWLPVPIALLLGAVLLITSLFAIVISLFEGPTEWVFASGVARYSSVSVYGRRKREFTGEQIKAIRTKVRMYDGPDFYRITVVFDSTSLEFPWRADKQKHEHMLQQLKLMFPMAKVE